MSYAAVVRGNEAIVATSPITASCSPSSPTASFAGLFCSHYFQILVNPLQ